MEARKLVETVEEARVTTNRPAVDFSNVPEDLRSFFEGVYDAIVITEAINDGHKPDWDNNDEEKWYPWFDMSPSSFGFCAADYVRSLAGAGSWSRLKYASSADAKYSAEQFKEVWRKVQLG